MNSVRSSRRRRLRAAAATLVLAGLSPFTPIGRAAAEPLAAYSATASAVGTRVTYGVPGFLTVERFLDAGGPVSQAVADSAGRQSFAAMPHPGELVVGLPGLIALGLGQAPPAGYPLYAAASHPTAPQSELGEEAGPYHLLARADAAGSSADARTGMTDGDGPRQGARTVADVVEREGRVVATATSTVRGFQIPGALAIAVVRSHSVTTYGGGKPATETALEIDGGRVGDLAFTYGPEGFALGGTPVGSPSEAVAVLNGALEPQGFSLRLVAPTPVNGGAAAEVLEIVSTQPVPFDGSNGTLHYQLGGATSSVVVGAADETAPVEAVPAPPAISEAGPDARAAASGSTAPEVSTEGRSGDAEPATGSATPSSHQTAASTPDRVPAPLAAASPEGATAPVALGATAPSGVDVPLRLVVRPRQQSGMALALLAVMASGLAVLAGYVVWQRRLAWTS